MKRYFIELSYNGGAYNGWQTQLNAISVQETIENALSKIMRKKISITGCGRTDTGVHASFYVAHFDYEGEQQMNEDFIYHLNCVLPKDIAVYKIYETTLHARFDATTREYKYYISTLKNPFTRGTQWQLLATLDISAMEKAAKHLLIAKDFTSFAKLHADTTNNICDVRMVEITQIDNNIVFTIQANRYLRGMVRAIVGTLVDVGKGKLSELDFKEIVEAKDRAKASSQAPAQGLFLTMIKY